MNFPWRCNFPTLKLKLWIKICNIGRCMQGTFHHGWHQCAPLCLGVQIRLVCKNRTAVAWIVENSLRFNSILFFQPVRCARRLILTNCWHWKHVTLSRFTKILSHLRHRCGLFLKTAHFDCKFWWVLILLSPPTTRWALTTKHNSNE